MEYKAPKEAYKGVVREVTIGKGEKTLKVGGENILPFHFFDEGSLPNPPKFALEVLDMEPTDKTAHASNPLEMSFPTRSNGLRNVKGSVSMPSVSRSSAQILRRKTPLLMQRLIW